MPAPKWLTWEKAARHDAWISHVKDIDNPGVANHLGHIPYSKALAYKIVLNDAQGEAFGEYYRETEIEPRVFGLLIAQLLLVERRARFTKKLKEESQEERDLEDVGWVTKGPPDGNKIAGIIRALWCPARYHDARNSFFKAWFIDLTGFTSPKEAVVRIETCIAWVQKATRMPKAPQKFGQSGSNLMACHPRQLSGEFGTHYGASLPWGQDTYPLARARLQSNMSSSYHTQYAPVGIEPPFPGPCSTLLCRPPPPLLSNRGTLQVLFEGGDQFRPSLACMLRRGWLTNVAVPPESR